MNRTLKAILLSVGLCAAPSLCFSQTTVYDNSSTSLTNYLPTTLESGDQVTLAGTARVLNTFQFSYFFSGATASTQTWTLRMYAAGGTSNDPPVTPFFTSNVRPVSTGVNGFNTETLGFGTATNTITLPDTFTWTVQFSNLAAGQDAGLLLYGPPTVGSSFNDFWQKDGSGNWSLNQVGGVPFSDFGARITAVPEPGVFALGGLGALVLLGLKRFRKAPG